MGILDKFNDASRGVSEKAKNISEAKNGCVLPTIWTINICNNSALLIDQDNQ